MAIKNEIILKNGNVHIYSSIKEQTKEEIENVLCECKKMKVF